MTTDRYTRVLLTVIAASLAIDAGSRLFAIRPAHAADTLRCEIANAVEVKGKIEIDTFSRPVTVKVDGTVPVRTER